MDIPHTSLLLPEIWTQILEWLTLTMAEDGISRARCRAVCKAWQARDPDFIVPMNPGLPPLIRLSLLASKPTYRAAFSRILAHMMFLPKGYLLDNVYIKTKLYEIDVTIASPRGHTMRLVVNGPDYEPHINDPYVGKISLAMDWVYKCGYGWSELRSVLKEAISQYEEAYKYHDPPTFHMHPVFHVS
jgi:hypothetical protein